MIKYRLVQFYTEQKKNSIQVCFRVEKVFFIEDIEGDKAAIRAVNLFDEPYGNTYYCKKSELFETSKEAKLSIANSNIQKLARDWSEYEDD